MASPRHSMGRKRPWGSPAPSSSSSWVRRSSAPGVRCIRWSARRISRAIRCSSRSTGWWSRCRGHSGPGIAGTPAVRASRSWRRSLAASVPNQLTGLRLPHAIVIDPGHGGVDPGNPGLYFPGGLVEKDITLSIAKLLRAELMRRGLSARLTRTADTLIDLADRGAFCSNECDLFVSIHVNAMPSGRRQLSDERRRDLLSVRCADRRSEARGQDGERGDPVRDRASRARRPETSASFFATCNPTSISASRPGWRSWCRRT